MASKPPGDPPRLPDAGILLKTERAVRPSEPAVPRFSRVVTLFWSLVLLAGASAVLSAVMTTREHLLEDPERYLYRILGRDLDCAEYTSEMLRWQRLVNFSDTATAAEAIDEAIDTYRQYRKEGVLSDSEDVHRTLAILLAEAGRLNEAAEEAEQLAEELPAAQFPAAFREAYLEKPKAARRLDLTTLEPISPEWARDKLQWRLARARGDESLARLLRARMRERGGELHNRITVLSGIHLLILVSGVAAIGRWLWRRRATHESADPALHSPSPKAEFEQSGSEGSAGQQLSELRQPRAEALSSRGPASERQGSRYADLRLSNGQAVSPWSLGDGYAVLVRAAAAALLVAMPLAFAAEGLPVLSGFATLLSALPFLWFMRRYLLRPHSSTISSCFGLPVPFKNWRRLAGFSLAILSLMILGELVIAGLAPQELSLSESIPEEFLFDPWPDVLFSSLDAVIWAPILEELVFRGLLYASLRRRLAVPWAAILSGILFAVIHGYSLQGFLVIFWSGLLWALAYETSRSLLPGMICHAASNALAVLSPILIYRI